MKKYLVAPCYQLFIAPLEVDLDPNAVELISTAYIFSKFGHLNQFRDGGGRYFDHPKTAAWIYVHEFGGRDPRIICDLLLHDLREDSKLLSFYRIRVNFKAEIALDVRALTKLPKGKETEEEYLSRIIERGPWAILAKLFDRLHNLRTLDGCTPEKRAKQIRETRETVMPMLLDALRSYVDEWAQFADRLEEKMNEAISLVVC